MKKINLDEYVSKLAEGAERERLEKEKQSRQNLQAFGEKARKRTEKVQKTLDKIGELYFERNKREQEEIAEVKRKEALAKINEEVAKKIGIPSERERKKKKR